MSEMSLVAKFISYMRVSYLHTTGCSNNRDTLATAAMVREPKSHTSSAYSPPATCTRPWFSMHERQLSACKHILAARIVVETSEDSPVRG